MSSATPPEPTRTAKVELDSSPQRILYRGQCTYSLAAPRDPVKSSSIRPKQDRAASILSYGVASSRYPSLRLSGRLAASLENCARPSRQWRGSACSTPLDSVIFPARVLARLLHRCGSKTCTTATDRGARLRLPSKESCQAGLRRAVSHDRRLRQLASPLPLGRCLARAPIRYDDPASCRSSRQGAHRQSRAACS